MYGNICDYIGVQSGSYPYIKTLNLDTYAVNYTFAKVPGSHHVASSLYWNCKLEMSTLSWTVMPNRT